jgi:hypothetical protein
VTPSPPQAAGHPNLAIGHSWLIATYLESPYDVFPDSPALQAFSIPQCPWVQTSQDKNLENTSQTLEVPANAYFLLSIGGL